MPWKTWLHHDLGTDFESTCTPLSHLKQIIRKHLPILRQITSVTVGKGDACFFWLDRWLCSEPLSTIYPALFSHCIKPFARVSAVFCNNLDLSLRNRLTVVAEAELASLLALLQDFHPSDVDDSWILLSGQPFSTRGAYMLLSPGDPDLPVAQIWRCHVPLKVKIFTWFFHRDRLNTRRNLLRKTIITEDACPRCNLAPETSDHLFFHCRASQNVWTLLGFMPTSLAALWMMAPLCTAAPSLLWPALLMTMLWKIWDSRNSVVFRHVILPLVVIVRNILADFTLWSPRLKNADQKVAAAMWRDYLSSRVSTHVTSPV